MREQVSKEPRLLWKLFKSTFIISAFTVGGGFVIIPLFKAKFVDEFGWVEEKEALNLISIAQSAPGVVACNAAIIIGYRLAGFAGTAAALLATVLPPLLILTAISYSYEAFAHNAYIKMLLKGMQCGATAIILDVAYNLFAKECKRKLALPIAIIAGTFVANYFFDVNIMYVILADACIGYLFLRDRKYGG